MQIYAPKRLHIAPHRRRADHVAESPRVSGLNHTFGALIALFRVPPLADIVLSSGCQNSCTRRHLHRASWGVGTAGAVGPVRLMRPKTSFWKSILTTILCSATKASLDKQNNGRPRRRTHDMPNSTTPQRSVTHLSSPFLQLVDGTGCSERTSAKVRQVHLRNRRNKHGVVAVEFSLVLPVLLLLVFGIIEFGLAMYDKAVITNASREAARAGVVLKNPKMTTAQIQNVALNYCQNHLITLGSSTSPTVTVPSGQGGSFGTPLTVTVTYSYSGLALGAMIRPFTGPLQLAATTVMNNE